MSIADETRAELPSTAFVEEMYVQGCKNEKGHHHSWPSESRPEFRRWLAQQASRTPEAAPSDTDLLSMEVIEEYRRIAAWLESKAAVTGPVGDTMHGLAAEAMNRLIDREYAAHKIPVYAMLDIWMALHGTSHPEFDEFYAKHGYAETWARLLAAVRTSEPVQVEVTEPEWEYGHLNGEFITIPPAGVPPTHRRVKAVPAGSWEAVPAALGGGE